MKLVSSPTFAGFTFAATLLVGSFVSSAAYAASSTAPATENASCNLESALNALLQIKDSDLAGKERDEEELKARKDVLRETVRCSLAESNGLKNKIGSFDLKDTEKDGLLQTKFLGDLEAAKFYFLSASSSIESTDTLDGIKRRAEEMLNWRNQFYLPAVQKMSEFVLVTETLQATNTAKTRHGKIYNTLNAFRLAEAPDIKKLLGESERLIRESEAANNKAHEIILNIDYVFQGAASSTTTSSESDAIHPPLTFESSTDASASSSSSTTPNASSSASSTPPTEEAQILSLVKESLGKIQGAYNNYLAVSKLVKKIIGF